MRSIQAFGINANFGGAGKRPKRQFEINTHNTRAFLDSYIIDRKDSTPLSLCRNCIREAHPRFYRTGATTNYATVHEKTVKTFSSAFKRTLRSGGLSIAAAASIQQRPIQQKNSASLLVRSAERKMHSKVVSEYLWVRKRLQGGTSRMLTFFSYWLWPSCAYSSCLSIARRVEA